MGVCLENEVLGLIRLYVACETQLRWHVMCVSSSFRSHLPRIHFSRTIHNQITRATDESFLTVCRKSPDVGKRPKCTIA